MVREGLCVPRVVDAHHTQQKTPGAAKHYLRILDSRSRVRSLAPPSPRDFLRTLRLHGRDLACSCHSSRSSTGVGAETPSLRGVLSPAW